MALKKVTCDKCSGTGMLQNYRKSEAIGSPFTCDNCYGKGYVLKYEKSSKDCPGCNGTGDVQMDTPTGPDDSPPLISCPLCEGKATVSSYRKVYIGEKAICYACGGGKVSWGVGKKTCPVCQGSCVTRMYTYESEGRRAYKSYHESA